MNTTLSDFGYIAVGVTCVVRYKKRILLFKRNREEERFSGMFSGPGGFVDIHEDSPHAAKRELYEETGIDVPLASLRLRYVGIAEHTDRKEVFLINVFLVDLDKDPILKESNEGKAEWMKINQLEKTENIFQGFKFHLKHVLGDSPGILFANLEFNDFKIVRVNQSTVLKN